MTDDERIAWDMYCEETAGDMDVRDFWTELPANVQQHYLDKVRTRRRLGEKCRAKGFLVYGRRES